MKLIDIFLKAEKNFSNQKVVIHPGIDTLTYSALFEKAEGLSRQLKKHLGSSAALIALCTPKNTQSFSALLGILHAGAAYVPIDAHGATRRNILILQNCKPVAIILTKKWIEIYKEQLGCRNVCVPLVETGLFLMICQWESEIALADDLALILYTSGSTGTPKGVQITHRLSNGQMTHFKSIPAMSVLRLLRFTLICRFLTSMSAYQKERPYC